MFKVKVRWFSSDGEEVCVPCFVAELPRVGESVDLSAQAEVIADYCPAEAKHLEAFRVLAVEHAVTTPHYDDPKASSGMPTVSLLLERDPVIEHQMELAAKEELIDDLRSRFKIMVRAVNQVAASATGGFDGEFGFVESEEADGPAAPKMLLAFRSTSAVAEDVPAFAMEVADVVYTTLIPGMLVAHEAFRCVKHRFRQTPFLTGYTGF